MFLKDDDLEEEDFDESVVVPMSLVPDKPQVVNAGRGRGRGMDPPQSAGDEPRSSQYQERLQRARSQKQSTALKRNSINSGMVVSNVSNDLPQRPGTAGSSLPVMDLVQHEIEEMDLEDEQEDYAIQRARSSTPATCALS